MSAPEIQPRGRGTLAAIGLLACLITSLAPPFVPGLRAQADTLDFVQEPPGGVAGQVLPPLHVRAPGSFLNPVTITLSVASGPGALLGTVSQVTPILGETATFNDLRIETAGTYILLATAPGYASATTASFQITPGLPDGGTSEISASPASIPADGASTSTITVQLRDQFGNDLDAGGDTVTLSASPAAGTIGAVADNMDGTYTATFTAGTSPTTVTVSGTVNGDPIDDTATIQLTPVPSGATSEITADPASIPADGASTSTITVQLRDQSGNPLTGGGANVSLSTTLGTLGPVADNGNGTYTATLTSSTTTGTATISGTVNGSGITDDAMVTFTLVGQPTLVVDVQPADTPVDEPISPPVVVRVVDGLGSTITSFTGSVTAILVNNPGGATLSGDLVEPLQGGIATFDDLRLDRTGNNYRLGFSAPGAVDATSATFDVLAGAASPATTTINASPVSIPADGSSTSRIEVRLHDAAGVPLSVGGDDVTLSTTLGTLSAVRDNRNGIYTATLRSTIAPGTATISGTVNGDPIPDTASVAFAAGSADLEVTVEVSDETPGIGDEVVHVVTVTNLGPDHATGIQVTRTSLPRLDLISVTASQGVYESASGIWSVGTLAEGERATLTVVARVLDRLSQ